LKKNSKNITTQKKYYDPGIAETTIFNIFSISRLHSDKMEIYSFPYQIMAA